MARPRWLRKGARVVRFVERTIESTHQAGFFTVDAHGHREWNALENEGKTWTHAPARREKVK